MGFSTREKSSRCEGRRSGRSAKVREWSEQIRRSAERAFYGRGDVVEKLLVALLCRGHVLIEDVPGVGKTIAARAIGQSLGSTFKRIHCTPDLLPADILGVSVYNPKTGEFSFRQGPILANVVLVDEINRPRLGHSPRSWKPWRKARSA